MPLSQLAKGLFFGGILLALLIGIGLMIGAVVESSKQKTKSQAVFIRSDGTDQTPSKSFSLAGAALGFFIITAIIILVFLIYSMATF